MSEEKKRFTELCGCVTRYMDYGGWHPTRVKSKCTMHGGAEKFIGSDEQYRAEKTKLLEQENKILLATLEKKIAQTEKNAKAMKEFEEYVAQMEKANQDIRDKINALN